MRSRLSPLTLALAALLIVHAVIITAALHYGLGVPRADTLAHHVDVLLSGTPGGDSWKPMATAARFAAEQPGASIYEEMFFRQRDEVPVPADRAAVHVAPRAADSAPDFVARRLGHDPR